MTGIIRSIEPYGIFIEISPNLSGLAEFKEGFSVGNCVSVHIKSINEEKMKIKLNIIGVIPNTQQKNIEYFIKSGSIKEFLYSPLNCKTKYIYKNFCPE